MKIYFIDKTTKCSKYIKKLENHFEENIVLKKDTNFKMTKNDFVIITDLDIDDNLKKLKNIIFLVTDKSYKSVWNKASEYNSIDIIDICMPEEYIINRIIKKVEE